MMYTQPPWFIKCDVIILLANVLGDCFVVVPPPRKDGTPFCLAKYLCFDEGLPDRSGKAALRQALGRPRAACSK